MQHSSHHLDKMPTSQELSEVMSVYPKLKYFEELSCGLTDSLRNSLFADVQIEVEGETFNCHRIILASMSHYFKTMFTSSRFLCSLFFVLNFFSFWEGGEEGVLLNNKSFFQEMSVMFRLKLINTQVQSHWLPVDGTPFHIMFISSAYVGTYFKLGNLIKIQFYTIVQIKRRKIWQQSIEGHVLWHQNELQLPLVWPNKGNPINQS